jgi:hypothetical protein
VDDSVWISKSHHPLKLFGMPILKANKTVVLVRNPLDVIYSFVCFTSLVNHSQKPDFSFEHDYPEYWDWFVTTMTRDMKAYFRVIMNDSDSKFIKHFFDFLDTVPFHFIRYEDLISNPAETYESIFKFLLDLDSLEGTNIETMIKQVIAKGGVSTYKLKQTTG